MHSKWHSSFQFISLQQFVVYLGIVRLDCIALFSHFLGCILWDQVLGEHSSPLILGISICGEHSIVVEKVGLHDTPNKHKVSIMTPTIWCHSY